MPVLLEEILIREIKLRQQILVQLELMEIIKEIQLLVIQELLKQMEMEIILVILLIVMVIVKSLDSESHEFFIILRIVLECVMVIF